MLAVIALRCAEKRISAISSPTTAITAPTTSSLRSGLRVSHQVGGAGCGGGACAEGPAFPFLGGADLPPSLPFAGVGPPFPFPLAGPDGIAAFPLGLVSDLFVPEKGVFSGMVKSIAQMVCFSFIGPRRSDWQSDLLCMSRET